MEVKYNMTGPARKELVKAIENIIGKKSIYKKVPSCAYTVEDYTITKEGNLLWNEETDASDAYKHDSLYMAWQLPSGCISHLYMP